MRFMRNKYIVLKNENGLVLSPAANLVKAIDHFDASVTIKYSGGEYNAKSILGLVSAMVRCGETIEIIVNGQDEENALEVVCDMLEQA